MKFLTYIFPFLKKPEKDGFSDFFLHASKEKQAAVFKKALEKTNEDQRRVYEEATKQQT